MNGLRDGGAGRLAWAAAGSLLAGACTWPAAPEAREAPAASRSTDAARAEALCLLAHRSTLAGDPEAAALHLLAARELDPGDPWIHYALGTAHHTLGDYGRALEDYTRAIQLEPGHVKAWQWRAHTRRLLGDEAGAVEDCRRALALLESADPAAFAGWGGDRADMLRRTRAELALAQDALGTPALEAPPGP